MACARQGDAARASAVLLRAAEARVELPADGWGRLVAAHAAAGHMDAAEAAARQARQGGAPLHFRAVGALVVGHARAGSTQGLWAAWRSALDTHPWPWPRPPERLLNTLMGGLLRRVRALDEEGALAARLMGLGPGSHARPQGERADWERRAVAAYTEALHAGTVPRVETLSTCLACLRSAQPHLGGSGNQATPLPPFVNAPAAPGAAPLRPPALPCPGGGLYPERALVLFEEAQAAGVVPRFELHAPSTLDLRPLPPAAAEVALLTALRVLRRRRAASGDTAPVQSLSLRVHDVDELASLTAGAQLGAALRRARTGVRVVELLRSLGLTAEGGVAQGTLTLQPDALLDWLSPQRQRKAQPQGPPRPAPGGAAQLRGVELRTHARRLSVAGPNGWPDPMAPTPQP